MKKKVEYFVQFRARRVRSWNPEDLFYAGKTFHGALVQARKYVTDASRILKVTTEIVG